MDNAQKRCRKVFGTEAIVIVARLTNICREEAGAIVKTRQA